MKDFCSEGNVLYFDCVNVNILDAIFYYSFARGYHWRKQDLSVLLPRIACESISLSK